VNQTVMVDREAMRMILALHEVTRIVATAHGPAHVVCGCGYAGAFNDRAPHLIAVIMGGVASWLITEG